MPLRIFVSSLFLTISTCLFAQTDLTRKMSFDVTLTAIIERPFMADYADHEVHLRPGLGFTIINSTLFSHQVTLRELWFSKQSITGAEIKNFDMSLRYVFGKYFKTSKEKVFFNVSMGLVSRYYHSAFRPAVANVYDRNRYYFVFYPEVIPSLNLGLKNNDLVTIAIPLKLAAIAILTQQIENPSIPMDQRKYSTSEINWFPSLFEMFLLYRIIH